MSSERAIVLREAAAARSTGAAERARRALVELDRQGETITFAVVAARARVSRQFLYSHPDLRVDIERLRGQQRAPARLSFWRSLMQLDLIDEFRLDLHPYVAGEGTRLFDDVPKSYRLDLVSRSEFSNGTVGLHYRRHR